MADEASSPDSTTLIAFFGAVVIGGTNFVAVRYSNAELEPLYGATLRFGAAALLLYAVAMVRRLPMPRGRAAVGAALYGFLGFGVAYGLLYFALVGLSAGTTSVVTAAVPLVTLALAVVHGQERFTTRGVIGGVLAIAGIGVLSLRGVTGDLSFVHLAAALAGVFAIAESAVVVKAYPQSHPVTTNAVGMTVGVFALVAASIAFAEDWVVPVQTRTWLWLGWLVVLGSCGLFGLFLFVVKRWTASATVYALTLMPVVAVTLGAVVADEVVTIETIVGGLLVLTAVYIGALSRPRAPAGASAVVTPEGVSEATP